MGVRGLLSHLKQKGTSRFSRRNRVTEGTVLVVDGNCFAHWVCNQSNFCLIPIISMSYVDLRDKVQDFVDKIQATGAKLIFLFDSHVEVDKLETKLGRMAAQVGDLGLIAKSLEDENLIHVHSLPILAIDCIVEVLYKCKIETKFADGEADADV